MAANLVADTNTGNPPARDYAGFPISDSTVRVRVIDTTTNMVCPARAFLQPEIVGHKSLKLKTFCFLIEHEQLNRKILFDLGARKDLDNLAPKLQDMIEGIDVKIDSSVDEILESSGIELDSIDTIVWSHWHWDHVGDCSRFSPGTKVVVGPGFKDTFRRGWPKDPDSPLLTSDLESHELEEVSFNSSPAVEGIRYLDYFGDGSFYLLDLPGHTVGHIGALCRTTPTTFILLGGDSCHFLGVMRPTPTNPLPANGRIFGAPGRCPCSSHLDADAQTPMQSVCDEAFGTGDRSSPYYKISRHESSVFNDPEAAQGTVHSLQALDSDPNIWICFAHDNAISDVSPLLNTNPEKGLNLWKSQGLKNQTMWRFLNAFTQ